MHNFSIEFSSSPLWLLLLIPFAVVAVVLYFKQPKKFRKTRNTITSLVLHIIVSVMVVSALAGVHFTYEVDSTENQIILLVDVSDTEEQSKENRDDFVQCVLQDAGYDGYKIGVVTFGFDFEYAVPLTYDVDSVYESYLNSDLPDTSATNIAGALEYAATLFEDTENASKKIVLVTDGRETDELDSTSTILRTLASQKIKVDTAYISSSYDDGDVQVTAVDLPEYHLVANTEYNISVTLQSKSTSLDVTVELYDNDELDAETGSTTLDLSAGSQTITFKHTFKQGTASSDGSSSELHRLLVKVTEHSALFEENNEYYSYVYLEVYNHVLILENFESESTQLKSLLEENDENGNPRFVVDVLNFNTNSDDIPTTVDELRAYDQVIMNNVANKDMPDGFDELLYSYVNDYGGGLFTVGGSEQNDIEDAHAYDRDDMYGTLYQQMLPVEAIDYTPPVGVIIIIDVSSSMSTEIDGQTKLEWAKRGAIACLPALTERDYVGIMTLADSYGTILPLTSRVYQTEIESAIQGVTMRGTTYYSRALERAGSMLSLASGIEKRHVILISDAQPSQGDVSASVEALEFYKKNKISLSFVGIGASNSELMQQIVDAAYSGGKVHNVSTSEIDNLYLKMYDDLLAPEIKDVEYTDFNPVVKQAQSPVLDGIETTNNTLSLQLQGFYGVKARDTDYVVLAGDYDVPIYAQWQLGKGFVGSFMCDLKGAWSSQIFSTSEGKQLVWNMVGGLMPTENIRPKEIEVNLKEENYINQISINTGSLGENEYLDGQIIEITASGEISTPLNVKTENAEGLTCYVTKELSKENSNYTSCEFVAKEGGVYKIVITKHKSDGTTSTVEVYKSFAYSAEYNVFSEYTDDDLQNIVAGYAEKGNGESIADLNNPQEIFASFVTGIEKNIDPRIAMMIIAMVCFLLDIAVRKFKFKWLHEIIRDRKLKR